MPKCRVCGRNVKQLQGRNRNRCNSCNTKIRRFRTKTAAIALLGGKCSDCGYKGNPAAFEFHHERGKDFTLGGAANRRWELVKRELKKCILLCSNCHRIRHSDYTNPALLKEANSYRGRTLD